MDVIVFGTGNVASHIITSLEKNHRILFFVDNSEQKWGTIFERYSVKCPDEIKKYNCGIVISSTKYRPDILKQLFDMGINQDKIYFCDIFRGDKEYVVYPLLGKNMIGTEKKLIQYDLCHTQEYRTDNKKVLIFCTSFSTYLKQLVENVSKRYKNIEFSILTNAKESKEKIIINQLKHVYFFQTMAELRTILGQLPIYDAMHLLWMEKEWAYFYQLIRSKAKRLVVNIGGSDFYRATAPDREFRRNLISCADRIMGQTTDTVSNFISYYGKEFENKTYSLPYGIEVLEHINKNMNNSLKGIREKYGIPLDMIVVTCGHNAGKAHQHIAMIEAISHLPENIKKQIVCVFPMTYPQGCDVYIDSVRDKLEETGLTHIILTEFMDFEDMAKYALISDIMIHVQTTDQLSSAMLEEMYAGSVIIAGKWLPYQSLHDLGLIFWDIDSISGITKSLEKIITNIEIYKQKCVVNRKIIWQNSSWDILASEWRKLWD